MRLKSVAMILEMDLRSEGDMDVDPLTVEDLFKTLGNQRSKYCCTTCNGRGRVIRERVTTDQRGCVWFDYDLVKCQRCYGNGVETPEATVFDPIALGC